MIDRPNLAQQAADLAVLLGRERDRLPELAGAQLDLMSLLGGPVLRRHDEWSLRSRVAYPCEACQQPSDISRREIPVVEVLWAYSDADRSGRGRLASLEPGERRSLRLIENLSTHAISRLFVVCRPCAGRVLKRCAHEESEGDHMWRRCQSLARPGDFCGEHSTKGAAASRRKYAWDTEPPVGERRARTAAPKPFESRLSTPADWPGGVKLGFQEVVDQLAETSTRPERLIAYLIRPEEIVVLTRETEQ